MYYGVYWEKADEYDGVWMSYDESELRDEYATALMDESFILLYENYCETHEGISEVRMEEILDHMSVEDIFALAGCEVVALSFPWLNYELKDDGTKAGGTSYQGETLGDFVVDEDLRVHALKDPMTELDRAVINDALVDCGIEPINWNNF